MMENLCQEITASHMHRQALLEELKSGPRLLRKETTLKLQGFRKQFTAFQKDLQAAREVWRKAAKTLAGKRRHAR